jgi:ketosteroid isomerase-like protein
MTAISIRAYWRTVTQENVQLLHRAYDAMNRRDLDAFLALMDEDVQAIPRVVALEGAYSGHDGIRAWWTHLVRFLPNVVVKPVAVRDLGATTLVNVQVEGRGAVSELPLDETLWTAVAWREGKCVWWRNFDTEDDALQAVEAREHANGDVVRLAYDALARGGIGRFLEHFTDDVDYRAVSGAPDDVGPILGKDALRAWLQDWFDTFDEFTMELLEVIDAGDGTVVWVERFGGRARRSGVQTDQTIGGVFTIRDGKIARGREYPSRARALRAALGSE